METLYCLAKTRNSWMDPAKQEIDFMQIGAPAFHALCPPLSETCLWGDRAMEN